MIHIYPSHACESKRIEKKVLNPINRHCADLRKNVILGIIKTESNFRNAINWKARIPTYGYMQIQLPTARAIKCAWTRKQLMNPWVNIRCGCEYLRINLDKYGDYERAVAAYNAGVAISCNGKRRKRRCQRGELINQKYVNIVLNHATKYERYTL